MDKTRALRALVGLPAILAIAVTGPSMAQPPIRIGATMSQTGAYDTQGVPARNGYLLCQKHVNEAGRHPRSDDRVRDLR